MGDTGIPKELDYEDAPVTDIIILVNGQPVGTFIDEHGVQRFIPNGVITYMFENDQLDLNALCLAFHRDEFSLEDYQDFYQSIGYSVQGFLEVFGEGSAIADETDEPCVILNPYDTMTPNGVTMQ